MPPTLVSRRTLLATAAGTALLPLVPATARTPGLPFVMIGDWGRQGADKQREVGAQMGRTAEAIASRFVVSVGDNFYENGVTGLDDPQWQDSFEAIYAASSLQTRWDVILGNHDYRGDVQAQLDYSQSSPRWRMPARYFQRADTLPDGATVEFFYLDTSPFLRIYHGTKVRVDDQDTAAQLGWFDRALGRSTAKWKVVVGHHPIHTVTGGKRDTPELIAQIKPLLLKHGVKIYINGHDHNLQYLERDGIHFVTNGAGSLTNKTGPAQPGQFASRSHGFMTVDLSTDRFAFSFIDETGQSLFSTAIAA